MLSRVYSIDFRNIRRAFYEKIYPLNMGGRGRMQGIVFNSYKAKRNRVFYCKDGERVVGIGIVVDKSDFMVYVDPEYRRKGIGTKILQEAKRYYYPIELRAFDWDIISHKFYKRNNAGICVVLT